MMNKEYLMPCAMTGKVEQSREKNLQCCNLWSMVSLCFLDLMREQQTTGHWQQTIKANTNSKN